MAWKEIETIDVLNKLLDDSNTTPQIIFKHSSRCSISALALSRLQSGSKKFDIHILDVINYRDISKTVEQKLNVMHQSPQLIIVSSRQLTDRKPTNFCSFSFQSFNRRHRRLLRIVRGATISKAGVSL